MKRTIDICLAALLLAVFFIPMMLIAIAVKCTSEGPILYWSNRVGRNNRIFSMPKFRSMRTNTPQVAPALLHDPDAYLTPIGAFLRRTSLDELPQLFSVLQGRMSLVGPRPALYNQDDLIALRTASGIHRMLPGVTGWAQVNGRNRLSIAEKIRLESEYLHSHSLGWDLRILLRTLFIVARREGISPDDSFPGRFQAGPPAP